MRPKKNSFGLSYDIVVVGLGTAGSIALIAAAKRGLKVLGIESRNAMGGTGTLGAVGAYYFGSKGGLYEQINEKTRRLQDMMYTESADERFDAKAYVLEETAEEYGAEIWYQSRVTGVYAEGTTVEGIRCFTKGKFTDIESKILIDCTAEAEICCLAGCPTRTGRRYDGQTQPFSNMSVAQRKGRVFSLNRDSGYVRQNDCEDLSRKIIGSTALLMKVKDNCDEAARFLTTASILGVREGRTIVGEENITLEGFFNGEVTKKPLFYAYSNVDNHGKDTAFEEEVLQDWYAAAGLWGVNFSVGVPLGALIPRGYDGILTAGRCLAVDHNIASCIRMKSDMEKCGEAAAEAACLAIKRNASLKDIDYGELADILSETKCLDQENDVGFMNRVAPNRTEPVRWLTEPDEIVKGLNSEKPGIAIWSAKRMGGAIAPVLRRCLSDPPPLLRKHAALALGLLGDPSACGPLREMVVERDGFIHTTSIKYIYTRAVSAIYLLGKLRDRDSVEALLDVIRTRGAFPAENFQPNELYAAEEDVRFQSMSYALAALAKIAEKHAPMRRYVRETVFETLADPIFHIRISLKSNPYIRYDMAEKLREFAERAM